MSTRSLLSKDSPAQCAMSLVGATLVHGEVTVRITEVEAYGGEEDSASHARFGLTKRNAPMYGPAGRLYVYLCYGIHQMLNIVVGPEGAPAAVLIRSAEVIQGMHVVCARRQRAPSHDLLVGPGKVGQALAIDQRWNEHNLLASPGIVLLPNRQKCRMSSGPRIGIDFATAEDRHRPWRFADGDAKAVKNPKSLVLLE